MNKKEARKRAAELVNKMTLDEMISQLRYDSPEIKRLGVPEYNWWNEGLHGAARAGTATVFPQAIGLAASFDEKLLKQVGGCTGIETRAKYNEASKHGDRDIYKGLTLWAPNVNIFRDPRWGRGHETYGEDPYLTGRLAVNFIKGVQQKDKEGNVLAAACAKHFAVHSGPEAERHRFNAVATKKDMFSTYLPAFEASVKEAGVLGVMGAYNRVNGDPACAHDYLMNEVLKGKWGFDGYYTSDCWAIRDFHEWHKITKNVEESAALAVNTGCDVNCGCSYLSLKKAYSKGLVKKEAIKKAAVNLFTIRYLLGMFDKTKFDDLSLEDVDTKANRKLAYKAAAESMVLLENKNLLPLSKSEYSKLAVIGPNADSIGALRGNYYGTSSHFVTALEGFINAAPKVYYAEGCHLCKDRTDGLARAENRLSEALAAVEHADAAILCLGLDETLEGEEGDAGNLSASGDKRDLELPAPQKRLLEAVAKSVENYNKENKGKKEKKLIVCIFAGSNLNLKFAKEHADALIQCWYPGEEGGNALADLIYGKIKPQGKLPLTFYKSADKLPDFTDYSMKGRTYRYLEDKENVLYPFGYGLTYSEVEIKKAVKKEAGEKIEIEVSLKNKGKEEAVETLQLYAEPKNKNKGENPHLIAFKKVKLKAGEEIKVKLPLEKKSFSFIIDENGEKVVGEMEIYAGLNSRDLVKA